MDAIAIDTLRATIKTLATEAAEEAYDRGVDGPQRPTSGDWGNFHDNSDVIDGIKTCLDSQEDDGDDAWTAEQMHEDAGEKFARAFEEHLTYLIEREH